MVPVTLRLTVSASPLTVFRVIVSLAAPAVFSATFDLSNDKPSVNFENLTCRNCGLVGGQIEICIDFANLVFNRRSGICCTCQTEESMMSQVHDGLFIGGSKVLDLPVTLLFP